MPIKYFWGLCLSVSLASAQSTGGASLGGLVTDPSGAVIAKAKVTTTRTATNTLRETETNGEGVYFFPALSAGAYQLSIEAPGFKTERRSSITLTVGSTVALDIALQIGAPSEVITVTEETPIVETARSQTATVVDSRAIAELPVNGRSFIDFTLLTPGVVKDPTRGGDITFGGQRGTMNSLQVDGTDSNNVFFGQSTGRAGPGSR
ncbi:MAG: carboxypeptidase-like regulatory domain-containing protein, partial [Acidobacteriota bacterium]